MMNLFSPRQTYTRPERISDGVIHVVGTILALAAVPVLITLTVVMRGDAASVTGASIYGASLIVMLACSALYNIASPCAWEGVLRRLDHSAIYVKIAGTYSAFVLISGQGAALLAGLWVAALGGVALKIAAPYRFRWIGLALYIGMGWAGLVAGWPMLSHLSTPVLVLVATGGVIYTLGVPFYLMARLPYHIAVWHGFVLTASAVLFAAVLTHVIVST
ncbi:MAG: hemolysin III family protein [Paracoccaceae bacterium]